MALSRFWRVEGQDQWEITMSLKAQRQYKRYEALNIPVVNKMKTAGIIHF